MFWSLFSLPSIASLLPCMSVDWLDIASILNPETTKSNHQYFWASMIYFKTKCYFSFFLIYIRMFQVKEGKRQNWNQVALGNVSSVLHIWTRITALGNSFSYLWLLPKTWGGWIGSLWPNFVLEPLCSLPS